MNGGGNSEELALARRLAAARKAAGLTQQQMCQKADLSYSTLAKIERGAIKAPSIFTIQDIAGVLGLSLDELVGAPPKTSQRRQHSASGISFVYFDINGTLIRPFHSAFTKLAEVTTLPTDQAETAFWHYNDQICRGEMTMEEFNRALAERLRVNVEIDWQDYFLHETTPMPGMKELLSWVSERFGVGLLSNIMPGLISKLRETGQVPDINYDSIVDSSQVHLVKPDPKIYELAAERAGCKPSEILLVDDTRDNLTVAERAGWHVLWFDSFNTEDSVAKVKKALSI